MVFAPASILVQHLVMLWGTVGEECRNLLTLSFFCFLTPLPFGYLPYRTYVRRGGG